MEFEVIRSETDWSKLADEWNQLLKESITDVPFLRHEYLSAWWQYRGGGEWTDSELFILLARDSRAELVGVLPMFIAKNKSGSPALMLLGSIEISDFLDVLVRPNDLDEFMDAALGFLFAMEDSDWLCLDWYNLLDDSPTLGVLEALAPKHNLQFHQENIQPSPYIPLPDNFDEYLESIEKRYSRELIRKMRNAAGYFIPIKWYVVEDEESLDEELDHLFGLMKMTPNKDVFLTAEMETQMRAIAQAAFSNGWLRLSLLQVGREKAAAMISFDYNNRIWAYNMGKSPKFNEISPGIVQSGYVIMDAIEHGKEVLDLMRGGEEYKYHMGAKDRFVVRVTISR